MSVSQHTERLRDLGVPEKGSKPALERGFLAVPDFLGALTREEPDSQNALSRSTSRHDANVSDIKSSTTEAPNQPRPNNSFSRMSLSSMMGGLSEDKERGRSEKKEKDKSSGLGPRSNSYSGTSDGQDAARGRTRSQSPFRLRRLRTRDPSPNVEALSYSDAESDTETPPQIQPRNAFSLGAVSDDEDVDESEEEEDSEEEWSGEEKDQFDPVTERNTERNALIPADLAEQDVIDVPDPLGEGVNVVVPPEPYFPSTLNHGTHNPRRRKSMRPEPLPNHTSRPVFQRDRCTLTITHGDPARVVRENGRRGKRYSRYALEWGIGTVLRDGDEMLIVTVIENESKVDPPVPNQADRAAKLRAQQERQALAYILVRQAISLLQRTRLHVTVSCQAWHAKNRKHMLLGECAIFARIMWTGVGFVKCSVPVMVARRRLKRPPRRSAHSRRTAAGVDRMAPKVDQDVANMRDQMQREEKDEKDIKVAGN
ncbi:hypothetical protein C8Q72DRAFT_850904 [Fomitopsis betulina]|nr:hypothetical protein C8Q72DRAFT_850904 [Fomitopsis betulina]